MKKVETISVFANGYYLGTYWKYGNDFMACRNYTEVSNMRIFKTEDEVLQWFDEIN